MKRAAYILLSIFIISVTAASVGITSQEAAEEKVQIKEAAPFAYICIHHKGPFTQIQTVIGQLMGAMQSQNIMPAGPMIGVYYNSPYEVASSELEWEIGFPVTPQAEPQAPLEKKVWEYSQVASIIHVGAYEDTGTSIMKLAEWMQANDYVQVGPVLERYLTMPGPETKPEDLKSEIWIPYEVK
jgi:effector-binding domain-containing protein